jgi:hypothetical protein
MGEIDKPWFAARRFGIGSGWPIAWQGWVVLCIFIAGMAATVIYAPLPFNIVLEGIVVIAFCVLNAAKTRGGWRWRWGRED